jgi:hypothetical protein
MVAVFLAVSILLLFVQVFGGAIRIGTHYIDYVVPGIGHRQPSAITPITETLRGLMM